MFRGRSPKERIKGPVVDKTPLLAKSIPGRPPKVSSEEMRWIAETVKDQTPWQMKLEFGLWTLSLIGEVIYRQFGGSFLG